MVMRSINKSRKYGLILLMTLSIMLAGCTANQNTLMESGKTTTNNDSTIKEKQSSSNNEQQSVDIKALQDENETLKQRIAILEDSDIVNFYNSDFVNEMYTNWISEYPHLEKFTGPQEFDSIELSSAYGEIVISDPQLVQYANYLFIVKPSEDSYPGGHYPYDIEPFNITLTNSSGSHVLRAAAQGYVTFEEDSYYVFQVSPEVAHLGRALLPRPSYLPEESLESRLINSGGIIISRDEDSYYYDFSQSKQRSITTMFLEGDKKLISEDKVKNSTFVMDIIYLLHGEQVLMRVFEDYILISDNDGETFWYKINPDFAIGINATINAG